VGLPIADKHLFTPNSVAARVMIERGYRQVMVLGTQGVADALEEFGVPCCFPGTEAAAIADAVYAAWHPECTMEDIHAACALVLDGGAFLTASDVPYFATKDGRSFGYSCAINGAVARVTGREPEPCGKPSALAMEFVARELGLDTAQVAVVGDDAVAEMQMARAGGALGVAVTSGSTSREEWAAQPDERRPDLVIENVGELLEGGWLD
jgi:4-nitrophenyl phosphatase